MNSIDRGMLSHDMNAHGTTTRAGALLHLQQTTRGASRWPPLLLLACALASAQARAQHAHVHAHAQTDAQDTPATPPDTKPSATPSPEHDHSSMDHSSMDHSSMDHSSMDHSTMGHGAKSGDKPPAPTTSRTPIPAVTDADRAAARGPEHDGHGMHAHGMHDHDNRVYRLLMIDRLETWDGEEGRALAWEAAGWVGTDAHKLWLRSEGEREDGHGAHVETEVLYGRPIAPWWDLLAGVRHDAAPGASRTELALGVMGMAPYKFEVDATLYIGENGRASVVAEAEYELLLTSRLILQPTLEAEWHSRRDAERGVGAGLSTLEAGLRLRYEWHRRFAPYVGVVHERSFGGTADFAREDGEAARETRVVAGVRVWF